MKRIKKRCKRNSRFILYYITTYEDGSIEYSIGRVKKWSIEGSYVVN